MNPDILISNSNNQWSSTAQVLLWITSVGRTSDPAKLHYLHVQLSSCIAELVLPDLNAGFGRLQWFLLFYTGMAWFADACEVMLLSFLGPSIRCYWGVSAGQESTLTSVVFAGMLAGVYTLGALADAAGRRRGFLISATLLGAAGLASAVAPSFTVRKING